MERQPGSHAVTRLRDELLSRLRALVEARGLDVGQVARRAGVHPKTIRRLLAGEPVSWETIEAVERGLRVDLARAVDADPADFRRFPHPCPVVGWGQAAQVLGVHRDTLYLHRRRVADRTRRPWWPNPEAVVTWYQALLACETPTPTPLHGREGAP